MKRISILALILVLVCSTLLAKSTLKALALSAALPGAGELYMGDYTKGGIFLGTEAAIIFTFVRLQQERQWAIDSYKEFALSKAGIATNNEDWYYQKIQDWESSDRYNQSIYRDARNYYLIYQNDPEGYQTYLDEYLVPDDMAWDWDTDANWKAYRAMRRDKQNYEIYQNFAVAALILNRLVSVVDITVNLPRYKKLAEGLSVTPDFARNGVQIRYEYRF